jgi:hypothetical protein
MCALRRHPTAEAQATVEVRQTLGSLSLSAEEIVTLASYLNKNAQGLRLYVGKGLDKRYVSDYSKIPARGTRSVKLTTSRPHIVVRLGRDIAQVTFEEKSQKGRNLAGGIVRLLTEFHYPVVPYSKISLIFLTEALWVAAISIMSHVNPWVASIAVLIQFPCIFWILFIAYNSYRRTRTQGTALIGSKARIASAYLQRNSMFISSMACVIAGTAIMVLGMGVAWSITGFLF